jgi:hypothetical protein
MKRGRNKKALQPDNAARKDSARLDYLAKCMAEGSGNAADKITDEFRARYPVLRAEVAFRKALDSVMVPSEAK